MGGSGSSCGGRMKRAVRSTPNGSNREKPFLSPLSAFLILLTLLLVTGGFLYGSASSSSQSGRVSKSDASSRPAASIRDVFHRLNSQAIEIGRDRDASRLSTVFATTGPMLRRADREIQQLLRDEVQDLTTFETVDLKVVSASPNEVVIRELRKVFPCFVDLAGRDITRDRSVVEQVVRWTLTRSHDRWLIYDAELLQDRRLDAQARCR